MRRATTVAALGTVGLALGAGVVPAIGSGAASFVGRTAAPEVAEPPSRVERLVAEHGCWTGAAPGSATPRRAVVTLPGRPPTVAPGSVGFALWLGPDGVPGTGDEGAGRLHAFCR